MNRIKIRFAISFTNLSQLEMNAVDMLASA